MVWRAGLHTVVKIVGFDLENLEKKKKTRVEKKHKHTHRKTSKGRVWQKGRNLPR
jgi:hypothetical protein